MNNLWTIVRQYFNPSPSLAERIGLQVAEMQAAANTDNMRIRRLEARAENLDAYYVKTVGTALKSHFDGEVTKLASQSQQDYERHKTEIDHCKITLTDVHNRISQNEVEIAKLSSRLTSFISNLRKLGEG